jgi:MFS superfamily sulfate permease-like transporter
MATQPQAHSKKSGGIKSAFPIITWLPRYERAWLRVDLMAGLAVWAMMVPQALAYAGIAGVPPVYGLYAVPLAMAAYAVFGTSRTLSVGPESAIAIISAVTVGALVVGDPSEFLALTSLLALIVGVLFLIFGLLRLGWAANFLSQPVLQGFTQGIALIVIIGQVPKLFGTEAPVAQLVENLRNLPHLIGLEVDYTGFFLQAWAVLATLGEATLSTTAVGLGALALLFAFRRFWPLAPSALIAVLLSVLAVSLLGLADRGVSVIGEVETGMVSLAVPVLSVDKVAALLPGAFAIMLLGYSSSGFVVCGSLSRGVVIRRAGGQTQVVSLVNAGLVFLTLLFVLPLFFNLPNATLSAIVIQAMFGLLNFAYLRQLFRLDRGEFAYAMAALFGVLVLGILQGVALGVVLSLLILIRRVSRPATAQLGRLPGTDTYRDITVRSEAETIPGLLIFRFDAPIIFANAGYFADKVRRFIAEAGMPVRQVLVPAQQINHIDSTGADQLGKLQAELGAKGILLSFAEVKSALLEAMRRTGLEERIGADNFYESIHDGVQALLQRQ